MALARAREPLLAWRVQVQGDPLPRLLPPRPICLLPIPSPICPPLQALLDTTNTTRRAYMFIDVTGDQAADMVRA